MVDQNEENIHKNKATQVDTENLGEEEKTMIQNILGLMKHDSRIELRGFNKIDRFLSARCVYFDKTVVEYVGNKISIKACESKNKKESKPCRKRRIEKKKKKNEVRKHINILDFHQRGEIRGEGGEKYEELERKNNIKKKGIRTVMEELK